jgi:multiple antibiotic resistance protein
MSEISIMSFSYGITVFIAIFAIVDPFGNIPIFYTITQRFSAEERKKIAKKAVISALIALIIFSLVGQYIFLLFSITIPAFRIAGGILLFRVAFNMLYGVTPGTKSTDKEKEEALEKDMIGIIPMGIPLLAGPGAISTVMLYNSNGNLINTLIVIISIILTLIITYIALRNVDYIFNKLGRIGTHAISRVMGLILAAIAIQFMINGAHQIMLEWLMEISGL